MAEAVDLAKMHGAGEVDAALEAAADVERFGDGDLARIHAPVGLSIGAKGPAEIAVSILAEIIKVTRGGG